MKTTTASDLLAGKTTIQFRGPSDVRTQDGEAFVLQVPSLPCARVETSEDEVAVHLRLMDEDGRFVNRHAGRVITALQEVETLAAEALDPEHRRTWVPAIREGTWRVRVGRSKAAGGRPACPMEGAWQDGAPSPAAAACLLRCEGVWEGLGRMGVAWRPLLVRFESG